MTKLLNEFYIRKYPTFETYKEVKNGIVSFVKKCKLQPDEEPYPMLYMEYNLMKDQKCPFIVDFVDGYCKKGIYEIYVEFMDDSLESLWDSRKPAFDIYSKENLFKKCEIMLSVARGLSYIHERYAAHTNLKASSVLISKDYKYKLNGFGSKYKSFLFDLGITVCKKLNFFLITFLGYTY